MDVIIDLILLGRGMEVAPKWHVIADSLVINVSGNSVSDGFVLMAVVKVSSSLSAKVDKKLFINTLGAGCLPVKRKYNDASLIVKGM